MRLMLLGPLRLVDDADERVLVTGPRQRILLATLAVHANQPVSRDTLAEAVWDGAPPPGHIATLRTHLARLRRCLGPRIARRIVTHAPGYAIELDDDEFDLLAFENHCRRAGAALRAADNAQASASGALALSLWRGEPLADVPSQLLRDVCVPRFERQRVQVVEDWIEAELRLGRHEPVLEQLRDLTACYPLRERFHAQLITALTRAGQRAEALEVYQRARRTLVDELGIEPGPELRHLHERILDGEGDPVTPSRPNGAPRPPDPTAAPRQLPAAAGHFTGRRGELELLTELVPQTDTAAWGTVVISAIDGMAGIGKTALAVHAAHRLSDRFPGGQLFLDLHGYTEGYPPREPGQALAALLRALEVPAQRIPEDIEERAALYRQRLARTRTLILLDNALDEAQVRPLLPGTPGCLILVTSRRRLKGLHDARSLSLDLLPATDAVALLRAVIGPDRAPADEPLLGEITDLCGRLPLALRIVGALLRHRPSWSLQHLAGLLRDQHRRVQALSDGERDLATVFNLSYAALDAQHRLLFRRLGLVPGPHADAYAVAALLDTDPATATGLLEDLVDHNLLLCHAPGRYRLHDLMRAHAHTMAATDPAADREGALDRLLHYYAHTAQVASIPITRSPRRVPEDPAPARTPVLSDPETARAWLRTERDNLEHAHTYAHDHNLHEHTVALAAGLAEILRTDGPYTRAVALLQAATDTAARHGHPTAYANALADLGIMRRLMGDLAAADDAFGQALEIYGATGDRHSAADILAELGRTRGYAGDLGKAVDAISRALEIYSATGDRRGAADMLADLGIIRRVSGDLAGAVDTLSRALEIYGATGDRHGEADALTELGRVRALIGDLTGADDAFGRALEFFRATGHHHGEGYGLTNLGVVRRLAGDLAGADNALTRALEIYRTIGYRQGEAEALTNLGIVRRLTGDLAGADDALTTALEIYRAIGSRHDEAWARNHHAATIAARGDLPRALALYEQALSMNRELDKPDGQALALEGLGECHLTEGETETGAAKLHEALTIYQRLGMAPDAERVRTRLADLATV